MDYSDFKSRGLPLFPETLDLISKHFHKPAVFKVLYGTVFTGQKKIVRDFRTFCYKKSHVGISQRFISIGME